MLGLKDLIGTIRPGLAADLVVLDNDPTRDIRATRSICLVLRDGSIVSDRLTK